MKIKFILISIIILVGTILSAITHTVNINGSADYTSIQAAIEVSETGDTVLVFPGRYYENINFLGKDITITSRYIENQDASYINNTIIDGNQSGSVVTFTNHETNEAELIGFTIENGTGTDFSSFSNHGGGILIDWSSPSLKNMIIQYNKARYCGGIYISSSNAYFEAVTIRHNHSYYVGGGLGISRRPASDPIDSNVTFSADNRCNIYNNTSGYGNDIFIAENHSTITNIYLDTLSVINPNLDYTSQYPNLNLDVSNGWLEQYQVDADLYVAPDGDDNNSGLSLNDPLRTITWALQKSISDSLDPNSIFLANGIYSPATNGERFPLNLRSSVPLIGADMYNTILREPEYKSGFITGLEDKYATLENFTLKDNTFDDNPSNSIAFYGYTLNVKNLKLSNIELMSTPGINSGGNLNLDNVEILNCRGFKALDTGFPDTNIILDNIKVVNFRGYGGVGGLALQLSSNSYCQVTNSLIVDTHNFDDMWPMCNINMLDTGRLEFHNNIVVNNASDGGVIRIGGGTTANISNSIFINNNSTMFLFSREGEDNYVNISNCIVPGGANPTYAWVAHSDNAETNLEVGEGMIDAATVNMDSIFVGGDIDNPLSYYPKYNEITVDTGENEVEDFAFPEFDALGIERIWDGNDDGNAIIDLGCFEYQAQLAPFNLEVDQATGSIFWETIPHQDLESFGIYLDDNYYCTYHQYNNQFCFPNLNEGEIYTAGISANYTTGESDISEIVFTYLPLEAEDDIEVVPVLLKNYPNPFNANKLRSGIATTIEFTIPDELRSAGKGELAIYNIKGQLVKNFSLSRSDFNLIRNRINWDGRDRFGHQVSSGVYLYYLKIGNDVIKSNKMLMLK